MNDNEKHDLGMGTGMEIPSGVVQFDNFENISISLLSFSLTTHHVFANLHLNHLSPLSCPFHTVSPTARLSSPTRTSNSKAVSHYSPFLHSLLGGPAKLPTAQS